MKVKGEKSEHGELALPLFAKDLFVLDIADEDCHTASVLVVEPQLLSDVLRECQHDAPDLRVVLQILHSGNAVSHGLHRRLEILSGNAGTVLSIGKGQEEHTVFSQLFLNQVGIPPLAAAGSGADLCVYNPAVCPALWHVHRHENRLGRRVLQLLGHALYRQ